MPGLGSEKRRHATPVCRLLQRQHALVIELARLHGVPCPPNLRLLRSRVI